MTLVAYIDGVDRAHTVQLGQIGLTTFADGTAGHGQIIFDDPDGSLDIEGWMSVIVKETDCTDAPVLFSGWIGKRTYSRASESTYRTAAARYINCDLVDGNALLFIRAMFAAEANRDSETEAARIAWLLGSPYLAGIVIDDGQINSSTGIPLDKSDFRGEYPGDVLASLVNTWIYFVYPIQPDGTTFGLFYNTPTASVRLSSLSISNDLADITYDETGITGDVFPPFIDATLDRDPSEVVARARLTGTFGTVIQDNPTTYAEFFEPRDLGYRSVELSTDRVHSIATAKSYVTRYLAQHSQEADTVTCTLRLPTAKVGLLGAGDRVTAKFTHLEGYESGKATRVTSCEVHQTPGDVRTYDVSYTLNTRGSTSLSGGGSPGDFPHPPPAVGGIVQQVSGVGALTMPNPIADGDELVFVGHSRGATTWGYALDGYTVSALGETQDPQFGTHHAFVVYKVASGESQTLFLPDADTGGTWYELAGEWTEDTSDENHAMAGLGVTFTAGAITVQSNSLNFATSSSGTTGGWDAIAGGITHTPGTGWVTGYDGPMLSGGPSSWDGHQAIGTGGSLVATTTSSFNMDPSDRPAWTMQIVSFTSSTLGETQPPQPAQPVLGDVPTPAPDGSTTTFTTTYPFADGSLKVWVDRLDQTAAVTSYDGAAGTFTLAFAPWGTDVIEVDYQGR